MGGPGPSPERSRVSKYFDPGPDRPGSQQWICEAGEREQGFNFIPTVALHSTQSYSKLQLGKYCNAAVTRPAHPTIDNFNGPSQIIQASKLGGLNSADFFQIFIPDPKEGSFGGKHFATYHRLTSWDDVGTSSYIACEQVSI